MICPYCGKENVDRAPFCADCGQSLAGAYDNAVKSDVVENKATESQPQSQPQAVESQPATATVEPAAQAVSQPEPQSAAQVAQPAEQAVSESVTATATPAPDPVAAQATQPTAQAGQAAPQPQSASQPQPQPAVSYQPQPQAAPQPAPTPQPQPACPVYARGCFGAAWSDITSSAGWFKKILLLGLIMCVPILNFYVMGYCMRWARQLVLGKIEPMPQKIFEEGNFSQGFYAWVWTLVVGLVVGIAIAIIAWIPLLGQLVALVVEFIISMFVMIGVLRLAISKSLGHAFDIPEDWRGFTKNFGSLFCAAVVPNLIVGAIVLVLALVLMLIIVMLAFQAGLAGSSYAAGYVSAASLVSIVASFLTMLPLFIVALYVYGIACAIGYLWSSRAVGHYVAREFPEWKSLAPQYEG